MKKYILIVVLLIYSINYQLSAQNNDTVQAQQQTITDDFQIPAYGLYQKDWNHDHVRPKRIEIPLSEENDVKIILVENNNPFVFPCRNPKIISPYGIRGGRMHTGVDIKQNLNDSIFSCFDGVVRLAKSYSGYGNTVVVRHYNGLETVYAHLNKIRVKAGEIVTAGQLVGLAGRTGRATTEHLHFETRFLYEHFNPTKMMDFTNISLLSNVLTLQREDLHINAPKVEPDEENEDEETLQPSETSQSSQPAATSSYHVVKQGDTLYGISLKYNVSVQKLCQLNHIKENSILKLGQKIKLQ